MGTAVIAIIVRQERELVEHFRQMRAISVQTAQPLSTLGVEQNSAWNRLVVRSIIRTTPSGDCWLDEATWEAFNTKRRRSTMVMLTIVIGLLIISAVVALRR